MSTTESSARPKFVQALALPKRYRKPGIDKIEVIEYNLRSKLMPNGYWITLAGVVIPSIEVIVFGASACSPLDAALTMDWHEFRADAANRALGRARQTAFRRWSGDISPGIEWNKQHETLLGRELESVYVAKDITVPEVRQLAKPLFQKAADHAALVAAQTKARYLSGMDKNFNWSFTHKEGK
jgi:hypothetical protein